jgi:alpha-tubulin suppressor-like RCC1 family protein
MLRCAVGVALVIVIMGVGCNQVFGIPEVHPGSADGCSGGPVACSPDASCTDTPDGSTCSCHPGFQGDGITCSDIDECMAAASPCAPDATCTNSPGSFTCSCHPGFQGDGITCSDIDECMAATSPCAPHATCTNSPGSFTCGCNDGFAGDGVVECKPAVFTRIAAADGFTCGISGDGGMYCWGSNTLGQLGDGTFAPHARPLQVGTTTDWIAVDARQGKACGLRGDHSLWCWGSGTSGALGNGGQLMRSAPVEVTSDKPAVGWKAFAVGRLRTCGIHDDGSLACWGYDAVTNQITTVPVAIGTDQDWTAISVGTVVCGLRNTTGGNLFCFGKTASGELGLGTSTQATPARVGTATWTAIGVGYNNACGIQSSGAMFCWGNAAAGRTLQYGTTPMQIGTATDWASVAVSSATVAALRSSGAVYLWGDNGVGQAGMAQLGDVAQPAPIGGDVAAWSSVVPGTSHSCGISGGKAYCWGLAGDGALGEGTIGNAYAAIRIGLDHWLSVTTGDGGACGLRSDSALLCWGYNFAAGVGLGGTDPVTPPTRIGASTWSALGAAAIDNHAGSFCAVRDGALSCWGDNTSGQLGIGSISAPELAPAIVTAPPSTAWIEVSTGAHSCAIRGDQALFCWGENTGGQLGNGTSGAPVTSPPATAVSGSWLHVVTTQFAGNTGHTGQTCGIRTDHTLWCWGFDNATQIQQSAPAQLGSDADWDSLTASPRALCAIKTDGSLFCRGKWIGDGTTDVVPSMTRIGGLQTTWLSVTAGNEVCAIRHDGSISGSGSLWCWGNVGGSPLGNGDPGTADPATQLLPPTTVPTRIGSNADWGTISTRGTFTCGTRGSVGTLWCWGTGATSTPQILAAPTVVD